MKQKLSLFLMIFFGIVTVDHLFELWADIQLHGWDRVNYGIVIFPLLFTLLALRVYWKETHRSESANDDKRP